MYKIQQHTRITFIFYIVDIALCVNADVIHKTNYIGSVD